MSERLPPDDDGPEAPEATLAAEYVLRLLPPEAAAAAAAREARDPGFAADVARWRAEFAGLDAAFDPVTPPAALGPRIEQALFGAPPSRLARVWGSLALWRAAAALAVLALALLTAIGPLGLLAPPPATRLVAAVQPRDSEVSLIALHEPGSAVVEFRLLAGGPATGRSLELWLLPEGETLPASLGVIPPEGRLTAPLAPDLLARLTPGAQILISSEPEGGSPTGTATGPVVAAGTVSEI